jgi:hypothetical protein
MATNLNPLPPLPPPAERVVDPKTGLMTTTWYLWFKRLDEHMREAEKRITAVGG